MSTEDLRSEIAKRFGDTAAGDDSLLKDCMSLCRTFNLSAEDLLYKWEAINFNSQGSFRIFTPASVTELKAHLHSEQAKAFASRQGAVSRNFGIKGRGGFRGLLKHATTAPTKLDETTLSQVIFRGPRMDELSRKSRYYRYMYEQVLERSEVLDDRIDCFAELVQRHYRIDELGDPFCVTTEAVTVVGRIVLDAEAASSGIKINESSLVLESSRMMGSGVRVPIRLTSETKLRGSIKGTTGLSFFPGAIVALRGRNGGGGFFSVDEILTLPLFQTPSPPPSDPSASFSMYIACGPFTADSDLHYKPWSQLFQNLKSTKPAVVLLIGPFVDAEHPQIMAGDMSKTPSEIFERHFQETLRDFLLQSPGSMVLLVPSVRDLISDHVVFPQCELRLFGTDSRIHCLPNPCRFSLNGVSFGVTSVDVLFHLRKEEYFKRLQEVDPSVSDLAPASDAMSNLARNLLQQRSFYPIFPVPLEMSHEVNLDVTHSEGLKLGTEDECAPDVLVLPSRLKQFSKAVDNSVVINPSFVHKGFYAKLSYAGQASGIPRDRVDVEISKIA
ncbi:DNA polymerase alpha, subunit B [Pisolithus tinctorius]|nr:DNA polymerase alpha, subunit B [Pisolithus tinctorius]